MTEQQQDYKVELEVFEGPLDLLLYLIKKEEVDIYNIPIETITTQYMEYLNLMRMLDLNIAGEFIVMAATLMLIKSRMLLPEEDRVEMEEEEEDPRWDLVRQLVEYKKFKDAALHLQDKEMYQENVFGLGHSQITLSEGDVDGPVLRDVSIFDLITAFRGVLSKAREDEIGEIFGEHFTVADKIEAIIKTIGTKHEMLFMELFGDNATKHEIICTFLALLELIRLRQLSVVQSSTFGEITVRAMEEEEEGEQGPRVDASVGVV